MVRFWIHLVLMIPLVANAYDPRAASTEMRKHEPEIQRCRQRYLDSGQTQKGVIILRWKINDHGRPVDTKADKKFSTLNNEALSGCLVDLVNSLTFPPAEGGERVSTAYKFNFD